MTQTAPISLTTKLADVPGIGARIGAKLANLGLTNVGKLIAHLPMRHEQLEAETSLSDLAPDRIGSARGEITATRVVRRGRPRFEAVLFDGKGRLDLVWFNQVYQEKRVRPGMRVRVQGMAKRFGPSLQMVNPRLEPIREDGAEPAESRARLRPVYPASEELDSRDIARAVGVVLVPALAGVEEHLPEAYRKERGFPTLAEAYRMYHAPENDEEVGAARRRLAFDELLLLQLGVHVKRAHLRGVLRAPALKHTEAIDRHIRERFPFTLTPSQDAAIAEIARDLSRSTPSNRLIQGDVGSGKTVVALYAMLMAVASGHQAALMSPTEILAEQHFESVSRMLQGSRVRPAILTGSADAAERERVHAGLADGSIDLVIGTHAILTETVEFKSLGVAVIDEQHRFGVHQRARLREKGSAAPAGGGDDRGLTPHVLVMTATPIPRTLAITLFGDLDISVIKGMPPGRRPIATRVVGAAQRAVVYDYIAKRIEKGQQAFVVVPTIGVESHDDGAEAPRDAASVRSLMKELSEGVLRGKRLAAIHGRLKHTTREAVMERFRSGEIDVLVATTVIEVGVDVPNATVMVVEHADRFGLAQLHQLRGRVGRGTLDSVCVFIGDPTTDEGRERLRVISETSDGFVLAERDFEIRGFGEVVGSRQSGLPPFRVADLGRDKDLLSMARRDAAAWIERSPSLSAPGEALLKRRLFKTYGQSLGLVDVG